jgi:polyisoprenoid-binding protein YceI
MKTRFLVRSISSALIVCASTAALAADTWQIDPNHSSAQFSVRHMGISTVRGAFTKVTGSVDYDSSQPEHSSVDVTIDANSVDTRVDMRDKDLKSDHFFDVAKYPTITFKSTKVESAGPGKLKVLGDLTIHGVTKPVTLDVEGPTPPVKDPKGKLHMGVSATTKVKRSDFAMTFGQGMVGDDVEITIDAEMTKAAPTTP